MLKDKGFQEVYQEKRVHVTAISIDSGVPDRGYCFQQAAGCGIVLTWSSSTIALVLF